MKLGELPIRTPVLDRAGGMRFLVAAQGHPGYGGTTLISEYVIGVGCCDGAEPAWGWLGNFEDVTHYGSNRYDRSAIHQWLNRAERAWYRPTHEKDAPPTAEYCRYGEAPYLDAPGFLSQVSPAFRAALLTSRIPVLRRTRRDSGALEYVEASVFLPSRTELCKGDENGIPEGAPLPLFYDHTMFKAKPTTAQMELHGRAWNPAQPGVPLDAPQIYDPKYGWWYWMRTPSLKYAFLYRVASPYGAVSYTYANNDIVGIRPMANLDSSAEVLGDGEADECFTLK